MEGPAENALVPSDVEKLPVKQPLDYFKEHGFTCFLHFTDKGNIKSIQAKGLLPWTELEDGEGVRRASNETSRALDKNAGKEKYVCLCLRKDHPMEYICRTDGRIKDTVWLEISLDVLSIPGVLFCDRNGATAGATFSPTPENFRWDILKMTKEFRYVPAVEKESIKPYIQAEILVPDRIPPEYITFPKEIPSEN